MPVSANRLNVPRLSVGADRKKEKREALRSLGASLFGISFWLTVICSNSIIDIVA